MESEDLPFVSVIIPTFNRVELLKETVQSVRDQTFRDFEIIVVNDGSSDGTAQWLSEQKDLRAVTHANSGIAASRNKGASIARGRWLAFLDHDDLWAPEKLQVQAEFVKAHPEVAMVAVMHERLGKPYREPRAPSWTCGDLFVKEYAESFIHTSSVMIREDVFKEIQGFPTCYRFADEFHVWLQIAAAHPIAYFDRPLVFIRFYAANTSHNRIGVRTDTYDILMRNYDPSRIPRSVFLRTMSDHDISFGRAYVQAGDLREALKWFKSSVQRTPLRLRGWRYLVRYLLAYGLRGGRQKARKLP